MAPILLQLTRMACSFSRPSHPFASTLRSIISRSIVEAHGGKMGVSANPVHGATFFFSLPAATAEDTE